MYPEDDQDDYEVQQDLYSYHPEPTEDYYEDEPHIDYSEHMISGPISQQDKRTLEHLNAYPKLNKLKRKKPLDPALTVMVLIAFLGITYLIFAT